MTSSRPKRWWKRFTTWWARGGSGGSGPGGSAGNEAFTDASFRVELGRWHNGP